MIVETQAVGPFFKNGFVLGCEDTREAVLIDPGDEVEQLLVFAERQALRIGHILLTHAHVDHITGVAAAKRALGVPIYLHRDDLFLYEQAVSQGTLFGLRVEAPPPVDVFYSAWRGDRLRHLRGAAPPHARTLSGRRLPAGWKTGDGRQGALRRRHACSPARSAAPICPAAITTTLIDSIRRVLFAFGDDAEVFPGHGPATTIGQERRTNPFLVEARD